MSRICILGSGGHAKVVIATAQAAGHTVDAAYDDDPLCHGRTVLGIPIVVGTAQAVDSGLPTVLAIGSNRARQSLARLDCNWVSLVHPSAIVHHSVVVGNGSVVFAGVVVQPEAVLGEHTILNTGSSVDHDCVLGDYVHIGPGARLCGGVRVGEGTLVGVGAAVVPGCRIGRWCTAGAGAVVVDTAADNTRLLGVPARSSS